MRNGNSIFAPPGIPGDERLRLALQLLLACAVRGLPLAHRAGHELGPSVPAFVLPAALLAANDTNASAACDAAFAEQEAEAAIPSQSAAGERFQDSLVRARRLGSKNQSRVGVLGYISAAAPGAPPHAVLLAWQGAFVDHTLQAPRPNGTCAEAAIDLPLPPVFDHEEALVWPTLLLAAQQQPASPCDPPARALRASTSALQYHERVPPGKTHYDLMPGGVRYTAALAIIEALYASPSVAHALRFGVPALLWVLEHGPAGVRVLLPRNSTVVGAALDAVGVDRIAGAWRRGQAHPAALLANATWRDVPAFVQQEPAPVLYWAYRAFLVLDATGEAARGASVGLPIGRSACPAVVAAETLSPLCAVTQQWAASLLTLMPSGTGAADPVPTQACFALATARVVDWLSQSKENGPGAGLLAAVRASGLHISVLENGTSAVPRAALWLLEAGSAPAHAAFAHERATLLWFHIDDSSAAALASTGAADGGIERALCGRARRCGSIRPSRFQDARGVTGDAETVALLETASALCSRAGIGPGPLVNGPGMDRSV